MKPKALLALLIFALAPAFALAQTAGDPAAGENLFLDRCAMCHLAEGTGPEMDRFLADPATAIPGTAMPIRIADPKQRADLIAYFAAHR